jgi:hypothetical protein
MAIYEWTDSMEKTLDIMRQNAAKLGELSLGNYNALKKRIHYLQLPLAILSAANAYAVVDLDNYVSENYVTIACCVVSATLAGYLSYDWYVDSQKQMEQDFSFQKSCEDFSKKIKEMLAIPRYERTVDGCVFMRDLFKQYKELITGNELIEKFKGDLTLEAENMEEFVMDHWNIIFRPTLRRFKKKNMELIECVKKGGQSVNDIVEPPVSAASNDAWKMMKETWCWRPPIPLQKEDDIESKAVTSEVNFSEVYTVKQEIPSMTSPKKEEGKKFHVAFTEQI